MVNQKYSPHPVMQFAERTWPDKQLTCAPIWCSVDLRDGNQSLENPMTLAQKLDFFEFLVGMGFKEIEIGFPAASETEFAFARTLIEKNLVPDDVVIQVLTQSRENIIRRTFEALRGAKKAVVHLYNSTSTVQRDVVFNMTKSEVMELALTGARLFNKLAAEYADGDSERFVFEYSPESFSQTEPDYALEVVNAVLKEWDGRRNIINLPFTVESATPNVHADLIEYMCNNMYNRANTIVSLHAHNDRGTAVAATELCLMAGADRVEGTLFGNGERTGNADILTLAMNLHSQGVEPGLDFSQIDRAIEIYTDVTNLPVHPRHPYAGSLVYTAFSGSHQDAIRKGMARYKEGAAWAVPYLPIDPKDVGRSYDPIIRINSQSGRGGVAYILENNYGISIPKAVQRDFGAVVTEVSDKRQTELSPAEIHELFMANYVNLRTPISLENWSIHEKNDDVVGIMCLITRDGKEIEIKGQGNGTLDAFCHAMEAVLDTGFEIKHYSQNALEDGSKARAISYVGIKCVELGDRIFFGAGVSSNIATSPLRALISAVNKMHEGEQ